MLCPRPRSIGFDSWTGRGELVPCGARTCIACRESNAADLQARAQLELKQHQTACFMTGTFSPEEVPRTDDGLPTLRREQARLFVMRLRNYCRRLPGADATEFRLVLIGEYGRRNDWPHLHAIIYGLHGAAGIDGKGHPHHEAMFRAWKSSQGEALGWLQVKEVHEATLRYVATHHVHGGNPRDELLGREPGFRMLPNRPGLGGHMAKAIAEAQRPVSYRADGFDWKELGDAPDVLPRIRLGGHKRRMPEYLKTKVRQELGLPERVKDGRSRRQGPPVSFEDRRNALNRERRYAKDLRQRGKL